MATDAENLQTAISQIIERIVEVTASSQPDYSENGRSISRAAYLSTLTEQLAKLREQLALAESGSAWEVRTRGIV